MRAEKMREREGKDVKKKEKKTTRQYKRYGHIGVGGARKRHGLLCVRVQIERH